MQRAVRAELVVVDLPVIELLLQVGAREVNRRPELFEVCLLRAFDLAV
jgi:hypothetical protein